MFKRKIAVQTASSGVGGLLDGTEVMTLDGTLPVSFLCPGDRVVTRAGAAKLARIEVEERTCAVVRLRLGDGRLARFAAGSKMRHPMTGQLVPADTLRNAVCEPERVCTLFHLVLEKPNLIYAAGCEVMSAEHLVA